MARLNHQIWHNYYTISGIVQEILRLIEFTIFMQTNASRFTGANGIIKLAKCLAALIFNKKLIFPHSDLME